MQIKILAATAVAAVLAVGCAPQEKTTKAKAPAKPKLMMGASASMLANTCAGCHGTNGQSSGPAAPTIAGMEADYLEEVLLDYKSGERHGTIMDRITKGYTDGELQQIAEFYAGQKYVGVTQTSVGDRARMGHKLHEAYCEKCHEDNGTSVEDTPLAGQWMPYIHWTIADYLNGHNNPEKKMKKAINKMLAEHPNMTKDQIATDLAHFYGSRSAAGYKSK